MSEEQYKKLRPRPWQGKIVRNIQRVPREVISTFEDAYTGVVLDFMGKIGAMSNDILPLSPGMRVCGPAVTCLSGDATIRQLAIDFAQPGDVLVLAAGGSREFACFGDGTAEKMKLKGITGVVIDGATRDAAGIRKLGFPTFCKAVTPRNFVYPVGGRFGGLNVPVSCGGVEVFPGDLILGDDDGVVVVPRKLAAELAPTIFAILQAERTQRREWTKYEPFDTGEILTRELQERGYEFVDSSENEH